MNHQERGDHLGPTAKATYRPWIREMEKENPTIFVQQAIKNEALQRHKKREKGTGHQLMACTTIAPTACETVACFFIWRMVFSPESLLIVNGYYVRRLFQHGTCFVLKMYGS